MPGKDVAAYWVEHVLRHGGTKHLQLSGKDMPFHQYYLLDVFAFLITIILFIVASLYAVIRFIITRCFISRSEKTKTN